MKKLTPVVWALFLSSFVSFSQDFNTPQGALGIPHEDGWYSGSGAYSISGATMDGVISTCVGGGTGNRWFKFIASSNLIRVEMVNSDPAKQATLTLFDDQFNQIMCGRHFSVEVSSENLSLGDTYYLSYEGTRNFSLRVSASYDNNWPEGALEIPHQDFWASDPSDVAFSTVNATIEGQISSCTGGTANRWFKFIATTSFARINLVNDDPAKQATIVLFDDQFNEIVCDRNFSSQIESTNLIIGDTYYISYEGNRSFSLSLEGGSSSLWKSENDVIQPKGLTKKVSIGTSEVPEGYSLAINGKAIMEEVKVQLAEHWPDFVFEKDYELRTLEEVEEHINNKGHLPEIPSEVEVAENGINLGEMDVKLLQKIEELTLYLIEQNKQNQAQQARIEQLEKELKALKHK